VKRSHLIFWVQETQLEGRKDFVFKCKRLLYFFASVAGIDIHQSENFLQSWYGMDFIAQCTGIHERTAYRCLIYLQEKGLLQVERGTKFNKVHIKILCAESVIQAISESDSLICQIPTGNCQNKDDVYFDTSPRVTVKKDCQIPTGNCQNKESLIDSSSKDNCQNKNDNCQNKEISDNLFCQNPRGTDNSYFDSSPRVTVNPHIEGRARKEENKDIYRGENQNRDLSHPVITKKGELPHEIVTRIEKAIFNVTALLKSCDINKQSEYYSIAVSPDYAELMVHPLTNMVIYEKSIHSRRSCAESRIEEIARKYVKRSIAIDKCLEVFTQLSIFDDHAVYAVYAKPVKIYNFLYSMSEKKMWGKAVADQAKSFVPYELAPVKIELFQRVQRAIQGEFNDPHSSHEEDDVQRLTKEQTDKIIKEVGFEMPPMEVLEMRRKEQERQRRAHGIWNDTAH